MNQFELFKTVLTGKESENSDKLQSFVFLRWLSGEKRVILASNMVNRYSQIPENVQYQMFRKMLHGKIKFIPYPKANKSKPIEDLALVSKHYNVTIERAATMIELVSDEELKYLRKLYVDNL